MSRGYLCVIWRPTWIDGGTRERREARQGAVVCRWGSERPRSEWVECMRRSLGTFRLFHPQDPLVLIDVDGVLTPDETTEMASFAAIAPGPTLSDGWEKTGTLWNKVIALKASPFRETLLFDLDFHFCGSVSAAFNVHRPLAALHYPTCTRTANRVNTGMVVCLDKAALAGWERARLEPALRLRREGDRDCDEMALDRAISQGLPVNLLPDLFGRYRGEWFGRGWAVDSATTGAVAYHWQSAKREMARDAGIARLLSV